MKTGLICFFLLLAQVMRPDNDLLQKAEKAYDKKNYKEAIENYQKLVDEGYKSPQLFFNLGNAYYRHAELGNAIYYYELARKMAPGDEDIRINLGIASSKTIDKIDSKENFFINAVKSGLLTSFTTNTWGWMSVTFIFLAAIFFFIFIDSGRLIVKRICFVVACASLILFVLTYVLGYSALNARYENKFGIITAKEVRVMNEPTAMAKNKFSLHEGTKIRVVENNGDWILIKLDNGNEGWVKKEEVGVI
jgi:tetratricopeptide (TPR) repeat protein